MEKEALFEKVAAYENEIMEKIAMNKMDKVFHRFGEVSKKIGRMPVNRSVQTNPGAPLRSVRRSVSDRDFNDLVQRGQRSNPYTKKNASKNYFTEIGTGHVQHAGENLPRKAGNFFDGTFSQYTGNTGLSNLDNPKLKRRFPSAYKYYNAPNDANFRRSAGADTRPAARMRMQHLIEENKKRIGTNAKPSGAPKDAASWF